MIDRRKMILLLSLILVAGFMATSLASYFVASSGVKQSIIQQELPLTSETIYSEIQKDLVQPVFVAAGMAGDTFLREWALTGEKDLKAITQYLLEIKNRNQYLTTFFVSQLTENYYHSGGLLKKIAPVAPRDTWFYRLRSIPVNYEINVDPDLAHQDVLTVFVNHKVFDFQGQFIGATGVGLTMDFLKQRLSDYEKRYQRRLCFSDRSGKILMSSSEHFPLGKNLQDLEGLSVHTARILLEAEGSFEYNVQGRTALLNARRIPELGWTLLVQKDADPALDSLRTTLWVNLLVSLGITAGVLVLIWFIFGRYQRNLDSLATTDRLTGLFTRQTFSHLADQALKEQKRNQESLSMLLLDLDDLKRINQTHGHKVGDQVLGQMAQILQDEMRESDLFCRWTGQSFLVMLKKCQPSDALQIAQKLKNRVEKSPFVAGDKLLNLSLSLGVSGYRPGESLEDLIARTEALLKEAKTQGPGQLAQEG